MKLIRWPGVTSQIWQIFIADSSSLTGAGLTGLVFNTASLTAYYHRDTDTTATAISLVTMTVGTFTSSGFKEIDATNMPGWYQFCPPNAALAAGAKSCGFHLKGATNMAPLPIEVDLSIEAAFERATRCIPMGTVGSASTTTSIVTSTLTPASGVTDAFKGRILIFDRDTTTAALRCQANDITGSTTGGVLSFDAARPWTTPPVSGDTFTIQ